MDLGPIVSNDVFRVPVADGVVARIRVQCHDSGAASFRAEPEKGDRDEVAALAAIDILKGYFEARGNATRSYFRRYHDDDASFRDVVDAVTVLELTEGPQQLLRDFQLLASSRVH